MRQATASFFFGPWHAILDGEKHSDMLPPSRTLKYNTYLGGFLCQEKLRLILL